MTPDDRKLEATARENLIDEFDRTWAERHQASIASFLKRLLNGSPSDVATASELCLIDLEYRWKLAGEDRCLDDDLGNQPRLQDYCRRWPLLDQVLMRVDCLAEEYRIRRLWGDDPAPDQFLSERPSANPTLLQALRVVDAELAADDVGQHRFAPRRLTELLADPRAPLLFSDFTLHELIGVGGMSKVYRATQRSLQRTVAIKALRKSLQHDASSVDRFIEEGRLVARLRHPNIVGVHGLGRFPGGGYFLALDYVDGSNLATVAADTRLSLREAVRITATIARAVEYAHQQGVLHCDLKPSNVLCGEGGHVYLTDFGLAQLTLDEPGTLRKLGGTVEFMAPELVLNECPTMSPAIDVYGLGALLYTLIAGRPPLVAVRWDDYVSAVDELPPARDIARLLATETVLRQLLLTTLSPSPKTRPDSARSVAATLERWLSK